MNDFGAKKRQGLKRDLVTSDFGNECYNTKVVELADKIRVALRGGIHVVRVIDSRDKA